MPYPLTAVLLTPGVPQDITLPYPDTIQAVKITNRSQYDVQFSKFGVVGADWLPAGTEYMLYAGIQNNGVISLNAFNTIGLTPAVAGVILISAYVTGENLPPGNWPVSIPSTGNLVASTLVNTNSPLGSLIILIQYAGDTAPEFAVYNSGLVQIGMGNAGAKMLELGPGTPLQIDVPASLASGGQPQIFTNQITGDVHMSTNGPNHRVYVDGNSSIIFDSGIGSISIGQAVTINGGTSGTASIYEFLNGNVKSVLIVLNNFRTGGANQDVLLPTAFTFGAQVWTGGIGNSVQTAGILFITGGVSVIVRVLTGLNVNGGTTTNATGNVLYENSIATLISGFDTLRFPGLGTTAHTGTMLIIGQ